MTEDPREARRLPKKKCERCPELLLAEDVGMFSKCRVCRAFVEHPDSESIAFRLTSIDAETCVHHRNPCYLRCGVEKRDKSWNVIPYERRKRWLER